MTLWLILLAVWLVGIPATVLIGSLLGVGYDQHRLARLAKARAATLRARRPLAARWKCGSRAHHRALRLRMGARRPSGRGWAS
jgi:hypothetical protein